MIENLPVHSSIQRKISGEMLNVRAYTPDENGVNFDEQQLFIVRRRDMSFLSDYFRRDARRYDNGFELY